MSLTVSRTACLQFDEAIVKVYKGDYLRRPSPKDLKSIDSLHFAKHGVHGMLGSLDCCHSVWKSCPKAWQGNFQGHKGKPSIIMEAVIDYNLWFWHVSYGHAGTMNDLNVLEVSPLVHQFVDGSFNQAEIESDCVPFCIGKEYFSNFYLLVDGIYPQYSRFVKTISEPVTRNEKKFASWQESSRKDVERGFGVLQKIWEWNARPIQLHSLV